MANKLSRKELKTKRQEKMARKAASPEPKKETKPQAPDSPLIAYLKGVRQEMRRVTWPTNAETISASRFVIITLIIGGLALWAIDTLTVLGITGLSGLHI
jgi:preprotein translocase subunit SecE